MKEDPMRSFLKSMLAFFTLGIGTAACTKTDAPPVGATTSDVTLVVPGMY
jgi:formate/nitrite transporter FocA (FNT family)